MFSRVYKVVTVSLMVLVATCTFANKVGEGLQIQHHITKQIVVEAKEIPVVPVQQIVTPAYTVPITDAEKDLLARLVTAEAKNEPHAGKVAVAEVVLNRVDDDRFPDTVADVIYEENQFSPVIYGTINSPADEESKVAVEEALTMNRDNTSIFFYNPSIVPNSWLNSREVVKVIGNHKFTK